MDGWMDGWIHGYGRAVLAERRNEGMKEWIYRMAPSQGYGWVDGGMGIGWVLDVIQEFGLLAGWMDGWMGTDSIACAVLAGSE